MSKPKRAAGAEPTATDAPRKRARRTGGQIALGIFKWLGILAVTVAVLAAGAFAYVYANTDIPKPNDDFQTNVTTVYFADGEKPISTFMVHNRVSIPFSEMPQNAKDAIVAGENEDFWTDPGVSVAGLARALRTALTPGRDTIGGSTITQQYVKVNYLTQERTITRKLTEIIISLKVAQDLSKEEILEGYLNKVYFGRGAYGLQAASQAFFGIDAKDLNDPQAIALTAMINDPGRLDPLRGDKQRQDLLERYQYTINQMVKIGTMTEAEKDQIYTTLPDFPRLPTENRLGGPNGYLMNKVRGELEHAGLTEAQINGGGLRVITTVDARLQDAAIQAASNMAQIIGQRFNQDPLWYHPALASIDTETGAIIALYNGPDAVTDTIPWAETPRPTGSTFKPWALVAALRDGATLNTRFDGDNKFKAADGKEVTNAGGRSYGQITLQDMTTQSVNTAYVDLVQQMGAGSEGPAKVERAAQDVGAVADLPDEQLQPTIPLGYSEVSPLNAARGLATLVNEGKRTNPYIVAEVQDAQGNVIYRPSIVQDQTVEPDIAQNATYALTKVVEDGTARNIRNLGFPVAGKTGTRFDGQTRATWFIGATKQISTAVVLTGGDGYSDLGPNVFGSTYTAPGWLEYMKVAMEGKERIAFPGPTNMRESGRFSTAPTPRARPTARATTQAPAPTTDPTVAPTTEPAPEPTPEPTQEPEPTQAPEPTQPAPQPTVVPDPTPAPRPGNPTPGNPGNRGNPGNPTP